MNDHHEENDPNLSAEEELELQKLRMKAMFGAEIGGLGKLPPDMELEWLKQIEKFEDLHKNPKMVKIEEVLNDVEIKRPEELSAEETEVELKKIIEIMSERGIQLDYLEGTPATDIYSFIVNEFLPYEMDDMRGIGFTNCFSYEDFHPNVEYDINHTAEDTVRFICHSDYETFLQHNFAEEVINKEGQFISRDDFMIKLRSFMQAYDSIQINEWTVKSTVINDNKNKAELTVSLNFNLISEDKNLNEEFAGDAFFSLIYSEFDYWLIQRSEIPGINI